jgi:hypothetical protein
MYPKLALLYFSLEYISIVYFSLNLSSRWCGLLLVRAYARPWTWWAYLCTVLMWDWDLIQGQLIVNITGRPDN